MYENRIACLLACLLHRLIVSVIVYRMNSSIDSVEKSMSDKSGQWKERELTGLFRLLALLITIERMTWQLSSIAGLKTINW